MRRDPRPQAQAPLLSLAARFLEERSRVARFRAVLLPVAHRSPVGPQAGRCQGPGFPRQVLLESRAEGQVGRYRPVLGLGPDLSLIHI